MRVVRRLTHAEIQVMRSGPPAPDDPYLTDAPRDDLPDEREFEPHDAQTKALIRQYKAMSRFAHSETVIVRIEDWRWLDTMAGPDDKQAFLEPLIAAVHRDPAAHEDTLYDVTRAATLDALYRYPTPPPKHFFAWLRSAVAHGALNHLRAELPELQTCQRTAAEADAIQQALSGLDAFGTPELRDAPNRDRWWRRINLRGVFELTEAYYDHAAVRQVCASAVGRLPVRQREVIEHVFFAAGDVVELATRRNVARSTIDNHSHAPAPSASATPPAGPPTAAGSSPSTRPRDRPWTTPSPSSPSPTASPRSP